MHRSARNPYILALGALVLAALPVSGLGAQQPAPPVGAYAASPFLGQVRNDVLYGDIWERPQLSARDRSLITVAVAQAQYATDELRVHMGRALDNGVSQDEIAELIPHVLFYSGFPTGVNAARVAAEVFQERGLPALPPGSNPREPSVGHAPEFPGIFPASPYLRDLLNDVLYAETWERSELSKRDRSMVTIAVAQVLYATDELRSHIRRGLDNGLSQEEVSEIITHVTFYSGFPTGVNASRVAAEVFEASGLTLPAARFPGAPYLDTLIDGLVFGVAWERSDLSPRDRSLATIAITQAAYQTDQLRVHLGRGLDNGLAPEELSELVAHTGLYSGFPAGVNGSRVLAEVFAQRGIPLPSGAGSGGAAALIGNANLQDRVFELRTYTSHPGRLPDVVRRFEDHTMALLEEHGAVNVGYWIPQDPELAENTLIYILAHESREAGAATWANFSADPRWQAVRSASEANGPIVQGVVRVFMDPIEASPLR